MPFWNLQRLMVGRACALLAVGISALTSLQAASPSVALPPGEQFFWGEEPVVSQSASRAEIPLNGLWLFQPAVAGSDEPPRGEWAAIRVPGSWNSQEVWGNAQLPSFVGRPPAWPDVRFRSESNPPRLYLDNVFRGWYQREIAIPADWKGRKIELDLERVSTDASVFVNGKKVGDISWPGGMVDLSKFVTPGQTVELSVLVTATASEKDLLIAMREDYADKGDGGLRQRGVVGNVWLRSLPSGPRLGPFQITTSVTKKLLSVRGEIEELRAATPVTLSATVREWPGGKDVRTWTSEVTAEPGKAFEASWEWPDPRLWDIGRPNLYTLHLAVKGAGVEDERSERFGFREIEVVGKDIKLNGRNFHGRLIGANADVTGGMKEVAMSFFRRSLNKGYSLTEIWPNDLLRRGNSDFRADYAKWADEAGILMLMPVPRTDDVFPWAASPPPEKPYQRWLGVSKAHIEKVRNSPSVLGYLFFGNEFMTSDDQNPLRLGNRKALAESQNKDVAPAIALLDALRPFDPSRPFASHSNANVGDFQTVNHYLGLTPLQDQEETPSVWAASGDMPYGAVEFCTPFSADMHRARASWNTESEPLATEFLAAELGAASFEKESPDYRDRVKSKFNLDSGNFTGWPGGIGGGEGYGSYEPYQALQEVSFRRIWRAWRTWGIPLGMNQWENPIGSEAKGTQKIEAFQPGRTGFYFPVVPASWVDETPIEPAKLSAAGLAYWEGIQPILAYIGGPGEADQWVAKENNFQSGETVRRSLVVINDSPDEVSYAATWQAGELTGKLEGKVAAGSRAIVPIEFPAPEVSKKTDLAITAEIAFTGATPVSPIKDNTQLRIHPKPTETKLPPVLAFDPEGQTSDTLRKVGFSVTPWTGAPVPAGSVLVVGRKALADPAFPVAKFEEAVAAGARAVLFSQDPDWLRANAGLRVHQWVNRKFWPVSTQSTNPLIAGLDGRDFSDWRGSGDLVPPRNVTDLADSAKRKGYPQYGYRVTNRGSVSSSAWEKPHHSGWTPILEGEFDLAYSPLLQLSYGKGLLISCSLDVESRPDPMALLMARRVVELAATLPIVAPRPTFFLGSDQEQSLLQSMTLNFNKAAGNLPPGSLLVVGPGSTTSAASVQAVLNAGGRVFLLGMGAEVSAFGMKTQSAPYGKVAAPLPAWPELQGLGISDLRLRVDEDLPLIQPTPGVETAANGLLARRAVGKGVLIAFQGNPVSLNAARFKYFRYSQWRWTRAISQILANLGGTFAADKAFFNFAPDPFRPIDLSGDWQIVMEKELPSSTSSTEPSKDVETPPTTPPANAKWENVKMPAMNRLGRVDLEKIDGSLWLRHRFVIPPEWKGAGDADLVLGVLDDHDTTYINGNRVGGIGPSDPLAYSKARNYRVPAWMLKPGQENELLIRIFDQFGGGGMGASDIPLSMRLALRKPPQATEYYVPGFLVDQSQGDDPARYTRW